MVLVVDASAVLPWCFRDEATSWAESLMHRLSSGDKAIVPAHFSTEIANALLMAERRQRIPPGRASSFLDELARFPILVRRPLSTPRLQEVLALAQNHGLTLYDACYLELAKRRGVALATLDQALVRAAKADSVPLFEA